jgi:hypothetical protein
MNSLKASGRLRAVRRDGIRGMKYSLRSLFVIVTLVCVVLGGRIEYLRRMAAFHEKEANNLSE